MKTTDLFKMNRSSKRLNESMFKTFGRKLNLETFTIEQLEDARNKLRTQIYTARSSSSFNENVENDALAEAQWMHDAIVAELAERDVPIVDNTLDEEADSLEGQVAKLLKSFDEDMNEIGGYGMPDEDKIVALLKQGDVEGAIDEVWYNYADQDGGELRNMDNYIEGLQDEFEYIVQNNQNESAPPTAKGERMVKHIKKSYADDGKLTDKEKGIAYATAWKSHNKNESSLDSTRDRLRSQGLGSPRSSNDSDRWEKEKDSRADHSLNSIANRSKMDDARTQHEIDVLATRLKRMDRDDDDWEKTFDMMRDRMNRYQSSSQRDVDPEQLAAISNIKYEPRKKNEAAQAKTDDKLLAYYAQRKAEKQKKEQGSSGQQDKNESINTGDDMRNLREGEIQQASAIVTAKTMVDRVGRWIEELSGMENDTLLQLGDSIRDEMGQEQAKGFIEAVAPAIQAALENLKTTREALASGVRTLTGEEQPANMLGGEPAADMSAEPDAMNAGGEDDMGAEDDFAAAEPAAGPDEAGREMRESINRQNRLLKVLAG